MGAVVLWVRSVLRRSRVATVSIVLLAGVSAGVVGSAFQAVRRAEGSIERHAARSASYDVIVNGCPPEVPDPYELSFNDLVGRCLTNEMTRRLGTDIIDSLPEVEEWSTAGTLVAGVVDPTAPNGWGSVVLILAIGTHDAVGHVERQILVDGRFADPDAPDEVVIGELAARAGGIAAGDTIQLASWSQEHIDVPSSTGSAPETKPIESQVVGIVRFIDDVQPARGTDLTQAVLPDGLYAGPGWAEAHGSGFASYGFGVGVKLRNELADLGALERSLAAAADGWTLPGEPFPFVSGDEPTLRRVIDIERQAVLVFAFIALVASMAFVGLTLARQLGRELADGAALVAVGFTRRNVLAGSLVRSLVIGLVAAVVAAVTMVAISPFGPVGIARRLEYSLEVRVDWSVLVSVLVAVPLFAGGVAVAVVAWSTRMRQPRVRTARMTSTIPLGAVARLSINVARGGSPRAAVGVGAAAVSVAICAGVMVASFDRVVAEPIRYGAWWDLAVGQYSDAGELAAGVELLRANPMVVDAAGFVENREIAVLDGVPVPFVSLDPFIGRPRTVMLSGRVPEAADEVALGAATALEMGMAIGDTLTVTSSEVTDVEVAVVVTGIAVLNNPVSSNSTAGSGIAVHLDLARRLSVRTPVAQSVVVRLAPSVDRQTAINSVVRDFRGSVRLAQPQTDLSNLGRIRFVPWLISTLVGILALATLTHALVTLLQRHRGDLAVLAALGMTRRQRRGVGPGAGMVIAACSIVVGVPAGLIAGRWVWRLIAARIYVPSGPVMPLAFTTIVALVAFAVAICVAAVPTLLLTRAAPARQLRAE